MRVGIRATAFAILGTSALACSDSPPEPTNVRDVRSPAHAVAQLRRFVAARDAVDETVVKEIVSPSAVAMPGDPPSGGVEYGRDAVIASLKGRAARVTERCTLEVALADARDAIGLAYCTAQVSAKQPPLQRPRQAFRIYELELGRDGTISRIRTWWDALRALRQVGVQLDADARPDVATGRAITALARGDQREATNERLAREVIRALDVRDEAALAHGFADGYVHHRLSESEPRTFPAADFARQLVGELAICESAAHRVLATLGAEDWIAVRYGRGCFRGADRQDFATYLWLMRVANGRIVEGWEVWSRQEQLRHRGVLTAEDMAKRVEEAGL